MRCWAGAATQACHLQGGNRLMLELMARDGMRVGEVLKLNATDVDD